MNQGIESIAIDISPSSIEAYCQNLARYSPNPEKQLAALDAISAFIAASTSPAEQNKDSYKTIRTILADNLEQARKALLDGHAERLKSALKVHDLGRITACYSVLSRESFWQLLTRAEVELNEKEWSDALHWAGRWLSEVRQRSAELSPYPDAIDFKAVNVNVDEYLAISDLCKYGGG